MGMRTKSKYLRCVMSAFAVLLTLFSAGPGWAKDLVVASGAVVSLGQDKVYDNVLVDTGGTLVLNGALKLHCNRFTLGGRVIISGDTLIEVRYGLTHPNSSKWAMRVVPNQNSYPYPNNFGPEIVTDYPFRAQEGAAGNPGQAGAPGVAGYDLEIIVHGNLVIESPKDKATRFTINLDGQHGGSGGHATGGGKGGNSGSGGRGGRIMVTVSRAVLADIWGGLEWTANGGSAGWESGNDAIEDQGGGGGTGGQGGLGGNILLDAGQVHEYVYARFEVNGGSSGNGGCAYNGDKPGKTAPGADGGRISVRVGGDLLPLGGWSFHADAGNGGSPGDCSCSSCYWWNAACACHQINNWTGQGGNGGWIEVRANDTDKLTFYARGGNGGNGLSGYNFACLYDGTNCLWGSNNGVTIGNGGDGASAGNGGVVSVLSETRHVGDEVTYLLDGGLPGGGGRGGGPGCSGAVKTCCTICPTGTNGSAGAPGSPGSFAIKRTGGAVLILPFLLGQ